MKMKMKTKAAVKIAFLGLGLLAILAININDGIARASFRGLLDEGSNEKRKIAFVHVGKTGGTTLMDMIAATCYRYDGLCTRNEDIKEETEISKQVQDYYHTRKPDAENFTSFMVTIRDPIDRIVSWFLYQHPENEMYPSLQESLKLWDCYQEIDDLATKGLAPIDEEQSLSAKDKECKKFATDAFSGKVIPNLFPHLLMNYQFYMERILQNESNEIFVIRTENFWVDWQTINYMLGGGETKEVERYTHREKAPVVFKRYISPEGIVNLCNALFSEIEIYEQIIERAVNIDAEEKVLMLMNMRKKCPFNHVE